MTRAPDSQGSAIVIGGGIVGVCCAYRLQREGFQVTLLERDQPGMAASLGNSGSIGLGSVPPLGLPGMLKDVPSMLLDPNHALVVRWNALHQSIPWFLKFAGALSPSRVDAISAARADLLRNAWPAFETLLAELGEQALVRHNGLLFVYKSREAFEATRAGIEIRRAHGIELHEMSGDEMRELEPTLSDAVTHGVYYPVVRTVIRPLVVTLAVLAAYRAAGGEVHQETVRNVGTTTGGTPEVRTHSGATLRTDKVVIATGVWSAQLARQLGDRIELVAERGYNITLTDDNPRPVVPILAGDANVAITTMDDGVRLTTMAEFTTPEARPDHDRAMRTFRKSAEIIKGMEIKVADCWVGSRPSTPDSLPVIGRSSRSGNILYAFGHGHLGLTFAPLTANLIAQLARNTEPAMDLRRFRPDRRYDGSHLEASITI